MKTTSLVPGSTEWLKSRSASKAPAMMGDSLYQTRSQLLHQMATGITKDVDAATQARFDNGHRTEELSRALAAEIIGDELAPISAASDDDYLTANFDGITFLSNIGYEHKDWNEKLATAVRSGIIPNSHAWQLDQQIYVGDLEYVLFVVSDGTKERFVSHKYYPNQTRIDMLLAGWKVFDADLAAYVPPEVTQPVVAEAIMQLPAVVINATGGLSVCNLDDITPEFDYFLSGANTVLVTDSDFVNADSTAKFSRTTAKTLKLKAKEVVDQIATVSEAVRTLELYAERFDSLGLKLEKLVKSEKEARRLAILSVVRTAYVAHVAALEVETAPIKLIIAAPDFAVHMKGLSKLDSVQNAVNTALANAKIEADAIAKDIRGKLAWCKEHAAGMSMLFPDLQQIIIKPMDDFTLTITSRIDKHKADEAAKIERIRAEEKVKAEAAAIDKQNREYLTNLAETANKNGGFPSLSEAADIEERRKAAQIAEQSKPFNGVPAKPVRPGAAEIIGVIMNAYSVDYNIACDWIIDVAENLAVSA